MSHDVVLKPPLHARLSRRGTAEIELVLSVVVLISILMLIVGATKLAVARLDTARSAQSEAFLDATTAPTPAYADDSQLPPIDGIATVRPRTSKTEPTFRDPPPKSRSNAGNHQTLPPFTIGGKAGPAGPPWSYPAYPVGAADLTATEQWFVDYITESHAPLINPLRLAPSWTP